MRLNDKLKENDFTYIVEFPQLRKRRDGKAEEYSIVDLVLKVLKINGFIDYVSVTESPSENTSSNPIQTAKLAGYGSKKHPLPHLTIRDNTKSNIPTLMQELTGIDNVLIVKGDGYAPSTNHFNYSSEMIEAIKKQNSNISVGAAGNPWYKNEENEVIALKAKADAGADFLITQPIFSVDQYNSYRDLLYSNGIEIPIIAGILPIKNRKAVEFVDKNIPEISIPSEVRDYATSPNSTTYARNHINDLITGLQNTGAKAVDIFSAGDAAFVRSLFDNSLRYQDVQRKAV